MAAMGPLVAENCSFSFQVNSDEKFEGQLLSIAFDGAAAAILQTTYLGVTNRAHTYTSGLIDWGRCTIRSHFDGKGAAAKVLMLNTVSQQYKTGTLLWTMTDTDGAGAGTAGSISWTAIPEGVTLSGELGELYVIEYSFKLSGAPTFTPST